jgi:hypothetical protein
MSVSAVARLAKLRAMPVQEIAGRIYQHAYDVLDRAVGRGGLAARPDDLPRVLVRDAPRGADWKACLLADRRRARPFFACAPGAHAPMRRIIEREHARSWGRTCAEADAARAHRVAFFGRTFDLSPRIAWQADPGSGRAWPSGWHSGIPITGDSRDPGDVKDVWELSRHQFLLDLGKRYWIERAPGDAAAVLDVVLDWIGANEYGTGINWANPLEPAYRSLSWLWAYHFCLEAPSMDEHAHARWLAAFHDHGRFLYPRLELYSSPFNHLIGEATALYLLGLTFPEFKAAAAWRARGRHILESRLHEQFYGDGGTVEQATLYHHATLGFYLLAALAGRAAGDGFPLAVWQAIERAIEFSMRLTQPDGRVPMIGDSDDARPIRLEHREPWDFRSLLAIGAVLFDRGDFKHVAGEFPEDALWILGPDGRERFLAIDARPPRDVSMALRESGYFILRSDWSPTADYACVDCGEQAGGLRPDDVPSAAHGHADCLSVTLFLGGRPALVDAGFYTYNGDLAWERHFRETAAHNTARVDGRDQARHLSKMAWCAAPRARLEHWSVGDGQARVVGSHDGYARGPGGVIHRRTVWLRPGGYVLLLDEFTSDDDREHEIELNFQLPPAAEACCAGTDVMTSDGIGFSWLGSQPLAATLRRGGAGPDEGWVAPGLGVRLPAPRLTLAATLTRRREAFLTVAADMAAGRVSDVTPVVDGEARRPPFHVAIATGEFVDHVVAGGPGASGSFETDASIAIWRFDRSRLVETARLGGTFQRRDVSARPADGARSAAVASTHSVGTLP